MAPSQREHAEPVHERQRRQLCGVHCVNNLLQLSDDNGQQTVWMVRENDSKVVVLERSHAQRKPATEQEFDRIADKLTATENRLLSGGEEEEAPPSFLATVRSNHRTPLLGNYSLEVLETALNSRGVTLAWFSLSPPSNQPHADQEAKDISFDATASGEGATSVGFIVNKTKTAPQSLRQRIQSTIGGMFGGTHHWVAISGIRLGNVDSGTTEHDAAIPWRVIDSESEEVLELESREELMAYLQQVTQGGGRVFRATVRSETGESQSI